MMNRVVLGVLLGGLLPWSTARADVTVCNDFRAPVNVAIAYAEAGSMTSEGWWRVEPNGCRNVPFDGLDFYYTVESDQYRDGRSRSRSRWGNDRSFYVGAKTFKFKDAERSRRGARSLSFSLVKINEDQRRPFTVTLRFRDGETVRQVQSGPRIQSSPQVQSGPQVPTCGTQATAHRPGGTGAAATEGLRVALCDSMERVRSTYNIKAEPSPSGTDQLALAAPLDGFWFFFNDKDKMLRNIRAEAPFSGNIHGIRVGDPNAEVIAKLGQPSRPPWDFGGDKAYVFRVGANTTLRCDFDKDNKVVRMFYFVN
jgi:uncharacterized membrane protein